MATAQANAAAPLDQLLVDVGAGPLRCWLPGRPGVEFIASLAGKPRRAGRRLSNMVDGVIGGDSKFILSTSGHIAAIVNPPGNPKASYRGGDEKLADAGQWMQTSSTRTGQPVGRLRRLAHRARRSAEADPGRTRHYRAGSAGRRARHLYLRELRFH
jgi:hypothetical protein